MWLLVRMRLDAGESLTEEELAEYVRVFVQERVRTGVRVESPDGQVLSPGDVEHVARASGYVRLVDTAH